MKMKKRVLQWGNVRKCGGMGENRRNFSGSFGGVLRIILLKFIKIYMGFTAVGITVSTAFFFWQFLDLEDIDTPEKEVGLLEMNEKYMLTDCHALETGNKITVRKKCPSKSRWLKGGHWSVIYLLRMGQGFWQPYWGLVLFYYVCSFFLRRSYRTVPTVYMIWLIMSGSLNILMKKSSFCS